MADPIRSTCYRTTTAGQPAATPPPPAAAPAATTTTTTGAATTFTPYSHKYPVSNVSKVSSSSSLSLSLPPLYLPHAPLSRLFSPNTKVNTTAITTKPSSRNTHVNIRSFPPIQFQYNNIQSGFVAFIILYSPRSGSD